MTTRGRATDIDGVLETVVVQPTPFCNIACRYCYLPTRDARDVMELATVATLFEKIFASPLPAEDVTVIWHAGEPLVVPVAYYREAFDTIERLRPEPVRLRHSFQTNGMLITPAWCDLFRQYEVGVGVSIDGPRHLHDAHRVTRAGRGTFDKTMAGIRMLQRENVPFHVITVLGKDHLDCPEALLDFYHSEGIDDVCFNVEESEGDHVSGLFAASDLKQRFGAFLDRFWTLARQSGRVRFIREIDALLPRIFRPNESSFGNVQAQPFGMINVDCHGNVSSFSPELLGYKNAEYNDFIVGNILTDDLEAMLAGPAMQAMIRDIDAGVDACRAECGYFSVCGGGAPINKLAERGSFRATRTSFCELTQIVPTDLILNAFGRIENNPDAVSLLPSHAPSSPDKLPHLAGAP